MSILTYVGGISLTLSQTQRQAQAQTTTNTQTETGRPIPHIPLSVAPEVERPTRENTALSCGQPARDYTRLSCGPSDADQRSMLLQTLMDAEEAESAEEELAIARRHRLRYFRQLIRQATAEQRDTAIETCIGFLILINALVLGFSMDADESSGWQIVGMIFSAIFLLELCIKVLLHGVRRHFCGQFRYMNLFDAFVVFIDLLLVGFQYAATSSDDNSLPKPSLLRLLRLLKLTRAVRLLRSDLFSDLLSMIQGMLGGMAALGWAMVLFILIIYLTALAFREMFGREPNENVVEYFSSVPRAMFTMFRCSFGDCSSAGGMPIFEHVHRAYGAPASILYCVFIFAVTIGLFNVISAIFVERTMSVAMSLQLEKRRERLGDTKLWNTRIATILKRLVAISQGETMGPKMSERIDDLLSLDMPCEVIDSAAHDPVIVEALHDLDIDPGDHSYLSDILDPDNSGTVRVSEIVDGLRRLRGDPRRSDVVTIDLMVRSLQVELGALHASLSRLHPPEGPPV